MAILELLRRQRDAMIEERDILDAKINERNVAIANEIQEANKRAIAGCANHEYRPSASKWQPVGRVTCIHCSHTID